MNGSPAPHRSAGLHDAVLGLSVVPGPALPPPGLALPPFPAPALPILGPAWPPPGAALTPAAAIDDYFWHSVGFRLVEVRLTGHEDLQRIVAALGIRTLQFRHLSLSQPGQMQRSAAGHRRLLLAYSGGDQAAAASITRSLIMSGYRAIERSGLIPAAPGPPRAADQEHAP